MCYRAVHVAASEPVAILLSFAAAALPLMAAEFIAPGSPGPRHYLRGLQFWLISLAAIYAWSKVAAVLTAKIGLYPLLKWRLRDSSGALMIAAGILVSMWSFDFFYYWFHRAQHRYRFLWRFHRVHHSIENMNCVNSYHHPLEMVFRYPFIVLPLAFFIQVDTPQLVVLSSFVGAWGYFIHADTTITLGRLGVLIGDNAHHRIHHSIEPRHFDRNFAAFLPLWDVLFRTYCAPEPGRWPRVGLLDAAPPGTAREYLMQPWTRT